MDVDEFNEINCANDIAAIDDLDIQIVVAKYKIVNTLNNADRDNLANGIIKHLLQQNFNKIIDRAEFIKIADVIEQLFPTETSATYFIPSQQSSQASGKLNSSYKKYRMRLQEVGLTEKRPRGQKQQPTETSVNFSVVDDFLTADKNKALDFVRTHTSPWAEVKAEWIISFSARKLLLDTNIATAEYVNQFPALALSNGYELYESDFEVHYPGIGNIADNWNSIAYKIIAFASALKSPDKTIKDLLSGVQHDNSISLHLSALKLLPYLLPNTFVKGTGEKKSYRPSKLEVATSFMLHFDEEPTDEPTTIDAPFVYLVGKNDPIAVVKVLQHRYIFKRPIEGIDCCFKVFWALNCSYSPTTAHVWQFLQKCIYNITYHNEKIPAGVQTLLKELQNVSVLPVPM